MKRSFNITARASDWEAQLRRAGSLLASGPEERHEDVFLKCEEGVFILRRLESGEGLLIFTENLDGSNIVFYETWPVPDARGLGRMLSLALGETAVLKKRRRSFSRGATRVLFDEVEGAGRFVKIEARLEAGRPDDAARAEAEELAAALGVSAEDRVQGTYAELGGEVVVGIL